jgi:tRNA-specific 2-thiouridylase
VQTLPVTVDVELDEPIAGVATGQTLVLYRGTQVVGSSTISATR